METIIGENQNQTGREKRIKCFVLAGGLNVITEYEERDPVAVTVGEEYEKDLYWINPMMANFVRHPTGQTAVGMGPLIIFSDKEDMGPINPFTIVVSHNIDLGLKELYETQVVKLKAKRAGLVQATQMPPQSKIGRGNMRIAKP